MRVGASRRHPARHVPSREGGDGAKVPAEERSQLCRTRRTSQGLLLHLDSQLTRRNSARRGYPISAAGQAASGAIWPGTRSRRWPVGRRIHVGPGARVTASSGGSPGAPAPPLQCPRRRFHPGTHSSLSLHGPQMGCAPPAQRRMCGTACAPQALLPNDHSMEQGPSAGLPVLLIGSPVNIAGCLIGSPITWHCPAACSLR